MHIAILIVLILIAVLIAPWLIGVAVAAVAAYGIYLTAAAALAGLTFVMAVVWVLVTEKSRREKPEEIHGERKACKYCQVEMPAAAIQCKNCGEANV